MKESSSKPPHEDDTMNKLMKKDRQYSNFANVQIFSLSFVLGILIASGSYPDKFF